MAPRASTVAYLVLGLAGVGTAWVDGFQRAKDHHSDPIDLRVEGEHGFEPDLSKSWLSSQTAQLSFRLQDLHRGKLLDTSPLEVIVTTNGLTLHGDGGPRKAETRYVAADFQSPSLSLGELRPGEANGSVDVRVSRPDPTLGHCALVVEWKGPERPWWIEPMLFLALGSLGTALGRGVSRLRRGRSAPSPG